LRWDVDICYPLLTGTNLLKTIPLIGDALYRIATGGGEACSDSLVRFYTWHIFGLTIIAFILMVWHAFRVRRDGGIAVPPPNIRVDHARISRNELLQREVLAIFVVSIVLIMLSVFFPAPIAPAMTENVMGEAYAPWFLLWIQQMLKWGDPFLYGVAVPFVILLVFALIPYIFPKPADSDIGVWFPKSNRFAQILVVMISLSVLILTFLNR
jgi:quinol-cytochrome oxidoreductase complex cytochrome b subunit